MTDAYRGPTFYWYDYETFGLNRRKDRPAQFAGLRTDMTFQPLTQGDVLYAKPATDYLPNPESCLVTGLTPRRVKLKGSAKASLQAKFGRNLISPKRFLLVTTP